MDHTLLHGPPGLGKTTMAQIIANELGVGFRATSGPVIARAGDLAALLTNLAPRDVLFIDEIHRLNPAVEEVLYPAMEDFQLDLIIGDPTNSQEDLLKVLNTISNDNKFENLLKNFLSFLITKRRFFYVEQILKSFIETCSKKRGELKAELKSAKELSGDEISKITDELTKNFSSKIKLNYKHDQSLIGGLVVQVGSTMVDTSIKNKLQQIENRMIEA